MSSAQRAECDSPGQRPGKRFPIRPSPEGGDIAYVPLALSGLKRIAGFVTQACRLGFHLVRSQRIPRRCRPLQQALNRTGDVITFLLRRLIILGIIPVMTNKEAILAFIEAINSHNVDRLGELMSSPKQHEVNPTVTSS